MVNITLRPLGKYPHGPLRKNRTKVVSRALIDEDECVAWRLRSVNNVGLSFNVGLGKIRYNPDKYSDTAGALKLRGTLHHLNFRTTR
jgi:hypothetical protein